MVLVVLCGWPCSGKTTVARLLGRVLAERRGCRVTLVGEESLSIARTSAYATVANEKNVRSSIKSAVDRELSRENLVICDSVNFVKATRFEMHALARAVGTPHCVVYCDTPRETCLEWNAARRAQDPLCAYSDETMVDLLGRMEMPNAANRWDKPLFFVYPSARDLRELSLDDVAGCGVPIDEIERALFCVSNPMPREATVHRSMSDAKALYSLDKVLEKVEGDILSGQQTLGSCVAIAVTDSSVRAEPVGPISLMQLRRFRRTFLKLNQHRPSSAAAAATAYVVFLNDSFRTTVDEAPLLDDA